MMPAIQTGFTVIPFPQPQQCGPMSAQSHALGVSESRFAPWGMEMFYRIDPMVAPWDNVEAPRERLEMG